MRRTLSALMISGRRAPYGSRRVSLVASLKVCDADVHPAVGCRCAGFPTAGDALGRDTRVAALIALAIVLAVLGARLAMEAVRTILGIWRRVVSRPYS